jgi:hypothetical protein
MAPINRDVDEERLARIEQMLEDLRSQVTQLSNADQRIRREAVTRENAAQARTELHGTMVESRARRQRLAAKKKR